MRIVDDVSTLMTLTYLYHCNEKKLELKFTKFNVFLKVQHLYHYKDYARHKFTHRLIKHELQMAYLIFKMWVVLMAQRLPWQQT